MYSAYPYIDTDMLEQVGQSLYITARVRTIGIQAMEKVGDCTVHFGSARIRTCSLDAMFDAV